MSRLRDEYHVNLIFFCWHPAPYPRDLRVLVSCPAGPALIAQTISAGPAGHETTSRTGVIHVGKSTKNSLIKACHQQGCLVFRSLDLGKCLPRSDCINHFSSSITRLESTSHISTQNLNSTIGLSNSRNSSVSYTDRYWLQVGCYGLETL